MRYVVEHDGAYLQVKVKGFRTFRQWAALDQATTWARPGHARLAANLAAHTLAHGHRLVNIRSVQTHLVQLVGQHEAKVPR